MTETQRPLTLHQQRERERGGGRALSSASAEREGWRPFLCISTESEGDRDIERRVILTAIEEGEGAKRYPWPLSDLGFHWVSYRLCLL